MPPRFAYWTIILDGTPTSFRAREREELLPTFNQLKKKDPTAMMKWFSGGTLWDSPEQASEKRRLAREQRFNQAQGRDGRERGDGRPREGKKLDQPGPPAPPPASAEVVRKPRTLPRLKSANSATGLPARPKGWRPGGDHRDPKDKYKLPPGEARKRWKRRNLGPPKAK